MKFQGIKSLIIMLKSFEILLILTSLNMLPESM